MLSQVLVWLGNGLQEQPLSLAPSFRVEGLMQICPPPRPWR